MLIWLLITIPAILLMLTFPFLSDDPDSGWTSGSIETVWKKHQEEELKYRKETEQKIKELEQKLKEKE